MENLREAFLKAARGKRGKQEVVRFRADLQQNLMLLRKSLICGDTCVGNYHYFKIYDPKERIICAASFPERVLHHAIMNVCGPTLERASIFDSYACRLGKGQFACVNRAQHFSRGFSHYLKLDVRKYFDSIPHKTLLRALDAKYGDPGLASLFGRILSTYSTYPGCGLPIGNLCSQHFANFYLGCLDRFIKENLRCRGYVRYMDDFVLWHEELEWLREAGCRVRDFAMGNLSLGLKPAITGNTRDGLSLVGFRIFPFPR
jgi:RNA-directed DNA polymerase